MSDSSVSAAKRPKDDNLVLAQMLRDACRDVVRNNVKLPQSIAFHLDGRTVRLHMRDKCVVANMQDNISSFEGWTLAFKRWLPNIEKVELSWDCTTNVRDPHYQRFLYRVQQFQSLFSAWFSVVAPRNMNDLARLRTETSRPLVVTSPKKDRDTAPHDVCATLEDAITNEHKLECHIKDNPEPLAKLFGLALLDRQFPVGLFDGEVKKKQEIFPRGHSAIDLWGVRDDELFLFELKAEGNSRIGILSELFFYSYVMSGVQKGCYALQDQNAAISATKAVRTYILAPQWHPLIDVGLLELANEGFRRAGTDIRFGIIQIEHGEPYPFKLKMRAER